MAHINNEILDEWWYMHCGFNEMEKATGYSRFDFEPDDGYQDFVDACDRWWLTRSDEQKKSAYKEVNTLY